MLTRRDFLGREPARLVADRPGADRPRLPRPDRPRRGARARRPRPGRRPARRRQRRDQHGRPVRRRGLRQAPQGAPPAPRSLIKVDDRVGLHPAMGEAGKLLESGRLAIVPGVGYPNPNRSHFQSMAIWQSARLDPEEHSGPGWLGRGLDAAPDDRAAGALRRQRAAAGRAAGPADRRLGARAARRLPPRPRGRGRPGHRGRRRRRRRRRPGGVRPPQHARRLRDRRPHRRTGPRPRRRCALPRDRPGRAAAQRGPAAQGGLPGARLLHGAGGLRHPRRPAPDPLPACSSSSRGRSRRSSTTWRRRAWPTACWCWASASSAAGWPRTARPGPTTARPGRSSWPARASGPACMGAYPSLTDLEDGDLKRSIDFRQVYATLLEEWLDLPSEAALGGRFERLALLNR